MRAYLIKNLSYFQERQRDQAMGANPNVAHYHHAEAGCCSKAFQALIDLSLILERRNYGKQGTKRKERKEEEKAG